MGKLTTGPDDPAEGSSLAALVELGRQAEKPPTEAQLAQGLSALRERLAVIRRRRSLGWRPSVAGAAAALLLVAGLWGASRLRNGWPTTRAVAVDRIEGGALLDGGYLAESGRAGVGVFFNEGSAFVLTPGTRGRLREVLEDGARFAIEEGAASLQITPNAARRWSVEAGPFLVTVTRDRLQRRVGSRQRALRAGPATRSRGGQRAGRGGRHFASCRPAPGHRPAQGRDRHHRGARGERGSRAERAARPARARCGAEAKAPVGRSEPGRRDSAAPDRPKRRGPALGRAPGRGPLGPDPGRGRSGRCRRDAGLRRQRRSAGARGCRPLSPPRRAGACGAARPASAVSGSSRALDALFLLGRVEELSADGAARAIAYYDDYLARAPRGGYAAEALGRKMILTNDLGGPSRARPIADEYLRRFPSGSYAGSARALGHAAVGDRGALRVHRLAGVAGVASWRRAWSRPP